MWCALVFPVIVPQLALLVRFSKISCRWDYSSTLGPEACGLSVLCKNTLHQTDWPRFGEGLQVPTQGQSWEPGRPSFRQAIHGALP